MTSFQENKLNNIMTITENIPPGRIIRKDICKNCGKRISSTSWTNWNNHYWVHEHTSEHPYPSPSCHIRFKLAAPCRGTVRTTEEEERI